jgi:radical SAM/SPASM domain protein of ACGX system
MAERFFLLQWHLTANCDQHCKHCYMYDEPTYESEMKNCLSLEQCKQVIDDFSNMLSELDIKGRINFTGGDPLLRKDFFEVLEYANSKKNISRMGILGNPFHIDEKTARRLKESGIVSYQISVDGLEKMHDYFRKPGSFKASFAAFKILSKAGIKTAAMFTLSRKNAGDLLPVIDLIAKEGIDVFAFARLCAVGTGKNLKEETFSPLEYKELLYNVLEKYRQLEEAGSRTEFVRKDHLFDLLCQDLGLLPPRPKNKKMIYGGCGIGVNSLCVLADGTVYACRRFPSPVGKVPEQKIWDIFLKSKQMNEYRKYEKIKGCGKCELLPICRGCRAVAYGLTGNYFARDPQCWKEV